jgi:hypothetical protein
LSDTTDPFALVRRLSEVPLAPLVDVLRRVHNDGASTPAAIWELLGRDCPVPAPAGETANATPPVAAPDYEAAREHFVRHSERLREQAALAERLLDGLVRNSAARAAPLQHELRVAAAAGTTVTANFLVVNSVDRPTEVRFQRGRVHGLSVAAAATVVVTFNPEQPHLAAGAEQVVELRIELPDASVLPNPLEFGVDVLGDNLLLFKLWVCVVPSGGAEWTTAIDANVTSQE